MLYTQLDVRTRVEIESTTTEQAVQRTDLKFPSHFLIVLEIEVVRCSAMSGIGMSYHLWMRSPAFIYATDSNSTLLSCSCHVHDRDRQRFVLNNVGRLQGSPLRKPMRAYSRAAS